MERHFEISIDGIDLNEVGIKLDATAMAIGFRYDQLARDRDAYARRLLEDRLPSLLHWTLDRPRTLRWLFRVAPRWRPTMTVVDLRGRTPAEPATMLAGADGSVSLKMPYPSMTAAGARMVAEGWLAEMRAAGKPVPDGGLIFTYTNPSGLPAEVYL